MSLTQVEEALRRSHCAHADVGKPGHDCRGSCTLSREGLQLKCELCGADDGTARPYADGKTVARAERLAQAFGVNLKHLTNERYVAILREVARLQCGKCGAFVEPSWGFSHGHSCPGCSATFDPRHGWETVGERMERHELIRQRAELKSPPTSRIELDDVPL